MKEEIINDNRKELIPVIKLFSSSYSTKDISSINPNKLYSVNTLNRKNTFKISEKECSDINSLVKNSVEKINDLLNFQGFDASKKNEKINNEKENTMKTNFTFNINNFINVPQNKNDSINLVNKKERYDDFDRNVNFDTNESNTHKSREKIYINSVRKKKLFREMNIQLNNNQNKSINKKNINIINFTNNKIPKNDKIDDKDKSITVNMRYKKYNINEDFLSKKQNKTNLNNSTKNKNKEIQINNYSNNILKYSISDEIQNKQNKKFNPNLININSLSAHKNIKNYIFKPNSNINKNNKMHTNNNINGQKEKSKKQGVEKKYYFKSPKSPKSPTNKQNSKSIKNINFCQEDCKALLFTEEKNNNNINKNKSGVSIFSKSLTNKNKEKLNLIHNINLEKNVYNNELQDFSRPSMNKSIKKENTFLPMREKSGYSCEHRKNNNYYTNNQNMHKILNKIYYKEFPQKIKTNTIMKLILFMNEYLISNNLLDDYYDISNQKNLENLSNFISDKFSVDYPHQEDVNFDQMINNIKKIQRAWRKNRMEKYLEKSNKNEENELKKMVMNKYIKKAGFKIKKIIGLFNSMVECFDLIENEKEIEEMFYNIQQVIKRKLSPYEKNLLYKEYINNIIYEN